MGHLRMLDVMLFVDQTNTTAMSKAREMESRVSIQEEDGRVPKKYECNTLSSRPYRGWVDGA